MEEEIKNELHWERIDRNDDISQLIDKLNFNFAQFAAFNGGIPGTDGADGANGMVTKSRCGIHTISKDDVTTEKTTENSDGTTTTEYVNKYTNQDFEYNINEVELYYNDNSNEYEELLDGDIIIYGPCIFKYNDIDNKKGFELISRITGEKGDAGESSNSDDGYFTSFDRSGKGENVNISFSNPNDKTNKKPINGIILEEESKCHGTGSNVIPISNTDEIFWNYSLLFTKTSTDGLSFFKTITNNDNEIVRYPDTQIKHNIELDNKITTSSSFEIVDDSLNGSSYISNNDSLSLKAIIDGTDASKYEYSIILGEGVEKNRLSINSKYDININFGNNIKIFNNETELLSLNNNKELETKIEKINLDYSTVTVKNIYYKYKNENKEIIPWSIDVNGDAQFSSIKSSSEITPWGIDENGDADFNSINASEIKLLKENGISTNISEIFAIKESGFKQFVDYLVAYGNTTEDDAKQTLRNQIGAIAAKDINITENNNFTLNTYTPVGTLIISVIHTAQFICDEFGGIYMLCNGATVAKNHEIKAKYYDRETGNNEDVDITLNLPEYILNSKIDNNDNNDAYTSPYLGGKFLVGYEKNDSDYSKIASQGGQRKVRLTIDNLPTHQHKYAGNGDMWGKIKDWSPFEYKKGASKSGSDGANGSFYYTEPIGKYVAHENRPPYYVVSYYVKIQNININKKIEE